MAKDQTSFFDNHYIGITTIIGISVALIDLCILFKMSSGFISNGIGLAMVSIVTFFGMLIASSVFEEHRHPHITNPKKDETQSQSNSGDKTLANVIAGKGIMRKAIASSLIITYIIVIGLYIDNGEINEPFPNIDTSTADSQKPTGTNPISESNVEPTSSINIASLQLIQNGGESKSDASSSKNSTNGENRETKPIPRSLLEHFTTVITAVIIFYFGADIASNWFKSKYGSSSKPNGNQTNAPAETSEQQTAKISAIEKKITELKDELEKIKKKKVT